MGKTRLAIACAARMASVFQEGVILVSLANTNRDPAAVAEAIGAKLGLVGESSRPEDLLRALREDQRLLVLDTYEMVACPEVGNFLNRLVTETRNLCLLVTSRRKVGIRDLEQQVDLDQGMTPAEARELFITRAQLAGPEKLAMS